LASPNRFALRLHLDDRIAGDQLLRLGEGTIGHGELPSRDPDTGPLRARLESVGCDQHAGLRRVLDELPHGGYFLLARGSVGFLV
jgi:hypothetical protein